MTTAAAILAGLRAQRNPANVEGQRRFGITPKTEQFGLGLPILRGIARANRRNHALALEL